MSDNEVLPAYVKVNRGKNKDTYYYRKWVNGERKNIKLGHTFADMMANLKEIDNIGSIKPKTLVQIWEIYRTRDLLEKSKCTQEDYERCWRKIGSVLGNIALEDIEAPHIKQYVTARSGKVRANREIALISILFNFAKETGFYKGFNPCTGVKRNEEEGRDRYVEDWEYEELWNASNPILRDALDLMLYTGQRVGGVLKMLRKDIKGKHLVVESYKTKRKVRILIEGKFQTVIDRILKKNSKVSSLYLIHDKDGQPISLDRLEDYFHAARTKAGYEPFDIQMRDIRAKNASDDTLENANIRLMHTTTNMTDKYRRKHKGAEIRPLHRD